MTAPSNANTSGLGDVGLSETYRFAYESIRNGAPGLSDATCAAIARSINMKVSLAANDRATAAEARADRLARFGQHTNWELSFCYLDDDDEDGCWTVHSVNGGRNDREWTVIGRGEAPDDAIRAALQQETQK